MSRVNVEAKTLLEYVDPTERQREFITGWQGKRFVLFGGAAGPGKSYALRWSLVLFLVWLATVKKVFRARVALFCEDYPSLSDRQISKIQVEFPSWLGRLRLGDTKEFALHEDYGGGVILLRNLDDPSKYLSTEFAGVGVDELTRNGYQTFNDLRLRLRWPGVDRPIFLGATNPGGVGHAWVKKLWIDREFPRELKAAKLPDGRIIDLSPEFVFVRALPTDNPHLNDQYWADLATLPDHMRKAYLEGDWNVLAGQYFSVFNEDRHVIDPPALERWWPRWISGDWGYKHPLCFHWHAMDDNKRVITYREWWGPQVDESTIGQQLTERSAGELIRRIFFSPDAWAQRTSRHTIAQQINDGLGKGMPQLEQADNDRVGGARLMYNLLQSGSWQISRDCPKLIECLPELVHGEAEDLEDVLKVDWQPGHVGDDPYDSARYGLKSYLRPKGKPWEEELKEAVQTIEDPTARAIYTQRLQAKRAELVRRDGMEPGAGGGGRLRWQRH